MPWVYTSKTKSLLQRHELSYIDYFIIMQIVNENGFGWWCNVDGCAMCVQYTLYGSMSTVFVVYYKYRERAPQEEGRGCILNAELEPVAGSNV
jgi:hypothetical protein